jgi:hypothetical protein
MPFNSRGQYYDPPLSTWAPQTPDTPADPASGLLQGGAIPPRGTPEREALKNLIYRYESNGGQNVPNYRFDPTHTAQGIGQITNSTWRDVAKTDPIVGQYSSAMAAPPEVQDRAVDNLLDTRGVSPWAPYNPKLAAALSKAGFSTGLSSPGSNKNMLPAFGNTRLLAQLTPQAPPGADTNTMTSGGDTSGLYNAASASGGGTDITEMLPKLMAQAKALGLVNSPSSMLANMSAGFLGGKGPAASLAGGFAGLAKSQGQDQEGGLGLLRLAMTAGLGTQAQQVHTFTALTNAGVPVSQAAAASGLQLPSSVQEGAGSDVHGDEFVKSLEPALGAQVKALAEGRMQFPNGPALKTPYWQTMLRNVAQYDPEFDAINYNSRSKTRADFTQGKSAQNMTAINTTVGHLGTLLDAGNALDNTSYPLVNQAVNSYRSATGDPRIVGFNTAKQAVADEMTRVFRGTGGSNADVEGWEKNLNAANSPEQLQTVIKQGVNLLASRASSIADQYKKGMGTTAQPLQLLNPHALETLKKIPGGDALIREMGGSIEATSPPTAPTAATVGNGANTGALRSTPSGIKYRQISP